MYFAMENNIQDDDTINKNSSSLHKPFSKSVGHIFEIATMGFSV